MSAPSGAALFVGFVGLLVVTVPGGGGSGASLSILAAVAITAGTLLSRRRAGIDVVQATGWHLLIGGVVLAAVAGAVEGVPRIDWTVRFVASLAFLALVGTALAYWAWFTETLRCPLGSLAAWTFLTPVFGVGFGVLLTNESPDPWVATGVVLVLASLWVSVQGTPGHRRAESPIGGLEQSGGDGSAERAPRSPRARR